MEENIAIKVEHVTKTFKLPHEKNSSLKSTLINFNKRGYEKQVALKDVSFEIRKGEFFGIVGRNGSGKSTLLKLLSGIYTPDNGNIQVNGKLTPFIELGVGFNPELSGRDNVYLNGALLGFSRKEMATMYEDIVEFAELERFMDQKLKNYSSGMQVRLAFSIAIRAQSDILLIDEVLAVGDANFQKKCFEYFYELKKNKKTVVLVTHDMSAVRDFCDRAILVHNSEVMVSGEATEVAQQYSLLNLRQEQLGSSIIANRWGTGELDIVECAPVFKTKNQEAYKPTDDINIAMKVKVNKQVENAIFGITVKDMGGREIFVTNTKAQSIKTGIQKPGSTLQVIFSFNNVFNDGTYTVTPAIANENITKSYSGINEACKFDVSGWAFPTGIIQQPTVIKIRDTDNQRERE